MKADIVISAVNEEQTIGDIVKVAIMSRLFRKVIVVDDGSTDNTANIANESGAEVVRIQPNRGKANAMREGTKRVASEITVFWDADLIGVQFHHFSQVLEPVTEGRVHMCVGVLSNDWGQRAVPSWSGQRAISTLMAREFFGQHPNIQGYEVESRLTHWFKRQKQPIANVKLTSIRHRRKEEKRGFLVGLKDRLTMYWNIFWSWICTMLK